MRLKFFTLLCFILPFMTSSQAVIKVDQQQIMYRGYQNPIDFAVSGYDQNEVFLLPHEGAAHKQGDQWYWTPNIDWAGKYTTIRIAVVNKSDTLIIDSTTFLLYAIDLNKFHFSVNPRMSHSGLPAFKRMCGLIIEPPFEYSHFLLDTMIRVMSYEVVVMDSLEYEVQIIPVIEGSADQDQQLQKIQSIPQGHFVEIRKIELSLYTDWAQRYMRQHPISPRGLRYKEYNLGYGPQRCQ